MNLEKTMHTLGRICRMVWPEVGDADETVVETITKLPAQGFGLLCSTHAFQSAMDDPTIERLVSSLPVDLPTGPLKIELQGPFYIGFYQQAHKINLSKALGKDDLRIIGEALFGATWQSELARQLDIKDSRRIREWLSGDRSIPAGVWLELAELSKSRGENLVSLSGLIMQTADT